ncbi:glutamate--cysteine ligase [Paucilactobacillus sp. N302-9]
MFSEIGQIIFDNEAVAKTQDFTMGLEVEMQRVDANGNFSKEPYPFGIGNEQTNPWITNDLLETMPEVVTPPAATALDAMHYLFSINNALRQALAPGELLWPLSMPPKLPADESQLQLAKMGPTREKYLHKWASRYGYREGTQAGAHINISIDPRVIDIVYPKVKTQFKTRIELENHLYTKLAQGFMRYRWLLTYLFGASPVAEGDFFNPGQGPDGPIRSIRQSSYGFGMTYPGDFTNVDQYAKNIIEGVKSGQLINETEFHDGVRLKGKGPIDKLAANGIQYLEIRVLDLNPTTSVGIKTKTLKFIRLLASYFIMSTPMNENEVNDVLTRAREINIAVAEEHPNDICNYRNEAQAFLNRIALYANQIQLGPEYQEELQDVKERIDHPEFTPSAKMLDHLKDGSIHDYALECARTYQDAALQAIRPFKGFAQKDVLTADDLKKQLFSGSWDPAADKLRN